LRVLIVEDDALLGAGLRLGLAQHGCNPDLVGDAEAADHALQSEPFDAVILDLGLPKHDGIWLLRKLRDDGIGLPVLVLTARDKLNDRVIGLDAGADDYLVKPFDLLEVAARLRALVRRSQGRASIPIRAGDITVDMLRREASLNDQTLALSPKELALLEVLAGNVDQPVPRARLFAAAYGWSDDVESNALDVHIHNLRRKLGRGRILTIRGFGYRLVADRVQ
jgi:DNA-binding response OmpR family regulator